MGSTSEILGISEEYIKKSCSLSLNYQFSNELFHVDKSSSDAVVIVFKGVCTVEEWFSGDGAFGETKINYKDWSKQAFPSLRSIGNEDVAIVNQAFLERFELATKDPNFGKEVGSAVEGKKLIIFTGHSSGGAIAMLATIWFLEKYSKTESTKCVTFGAPLVGDFIVSHALKREKWSKFFIHFVMRYDIVPRIMLAPLSSIQQALVHVLHYFTAKGHPYPHDSIATNLYTNVMRNTSALASHAACKLMGNTNMLLETLTNFIKLSPYRPFGTYIFCTGNGKLIHLDNPEAVLQLLFYSCQLNHENEIEATARKCIKAHLEDYKTELLDRSLEENLVCVTELEQLPLASDGTALDDLGLSTRGRLCLRAAGELEKQKLKNQDQIKTKRAEMEASMKGLREYKTFNAERAGYYNAFKKQDEKRDFNANVMRLVLAGIWDEIIEMLRRYDLPDEFEGEKSWIDLGTEFRRLVEPLDIANYYRHAKNEDTGAYMIKGRPRRYRYPQSWLEKREGLEKGSYGESCFLADVEELLKAANNGKVDGAMAVKVQVAVAKWIKDSVLDKEVFLKESTFLQLWDKLGPLKLQQECIRALMTDITNLSIS
ncbi:PREDICTED: protein EDS1B-like [Fragaria vesca subsp. vesca]|uniref:protein EDS1B-like n=1 Tax=Fragaria vesca subsp. vesca TaxID=101020 RepID=UPI0002C34FCB|nr:PREDICTED: protein EDS1B-like [Fragaria vesca subsp. vesca]